MNEMEHALDSVKQARDESHDVMHGACGIDE
jgi:hypothetical protein